MFTFFQAILATAFAKKDYSCARATASRVLQVLIIFFRDKYSDGINILMQVLEYIYIYIFS